MAKLILVGLPIGNKDDLTLRARKALEVGEVFFAEDTRGFCSFLKILGIPLEGKRIFSFHDQSLESSLFKILQCLKESKDVYLVSEAGSPVISDPAYPAIVKILEEGFELETIPGVTSVIVALELSGLPPHPFSFYAFLSRDEKEFSFLEKKGTHVFFESPLRVVETIDKIFKKWPRVKISLGRELTKKFESIYRFENSSWEEIKKELPLKGEFVVVIYSKGKENFLDEKTFLLAQECFKKSSTKNMSKLLAHILKQDQKEIYLKISEKKDEGN